MIGFEDLKWKTPLILAIIYLCAVSCLVELSIKNDYQCEKDPGLLQLACLLRNIEAVQLLIHKGVSVKMKDRTGKKLFILKKGFLTRSSTNQAVQPQKLIRGLKFRM